MDFRWRHAIDLTQINALEIYFNWLLLTYFLFVKPLSWFWNILPVIYLVRALLKHLPKNISAILSICDEVSILPVYVSDSLHAGL